VGCVGWGGGRGGEQEGGTTRGGEVGEVWVCVREALTLEGQIVGERGGKRWDEQSGGAFAVIPAHPPTCCSNAKVHRSQ